MAALFFGVPAREAFAAPKDAQADKAYKQAMEEDYLDLKFDDAQKKIDKAIEACGDSGCSPKTKAHLYVARATILGGGKRNLDEAKEAFVNALKLDPTAVPDPDYVKSEIKFAFDEAQKIIKKGGGTTSSNNGTSNNGSSSNGSSSNGSSSNGSSSNGSEPVVTGPLNLAPVDEQKMHSPIPVYVVMDDATAKKATSATLTYTGIEGGDPVTIKLEKSGKAFKGTIPCEATKKKGTVKFWISAKDKNDKTVANLGTDAIPNETNIKKSIDGKPPSWPGFAPPDACDAGETKAGPSDELKAKSSLRQCVDDKDCPSTEKCSENQCLRRPDAVDSTDPSPDPDTKDPNEKEAAEKRRFWFSLIFMPDLAPVSGVDVCTKQSQATSGFGCLRAAGTGGNPDRSAYTGTPEVAQGDNINSGLGVGQMRLMLGFDATIVEGFSLGARIGYAFNGTTGPLSYLPVHVEARAAYAFGSRAYSRNNPAVARPWIEAFGGAAQFDFPVDVQVAEDGVVCGAASPKNLKSPCQPDYGKAGGKDGTARVQTLTAIKRAGLGFIGFGAGVSFLPAKMFAINLGARFTGSIPTFIPIISPEAGISVGF